ncbi:unnamed protein product [Mycena citricolor]|uniref:Mediator of RNA polymerase II transcription subunit 6 n=1 Tax=Mycena citricolor TaxID=2018698 RepID=A0AAD2GWJ9_9AGAR|nr:unnamed protein product [Mycena citricolor]CAK5279928.1 unnamed protein product [Mycena citricolor]
MGEMRHSQSVTAMTALLIRYRRIKPLHELDSLVLSVGESLTSSECAFSNPIRGSHILGAYIYQMPPAQGPPPQLAFYFHLLLPESSHFRFALSISACICLRLLVAGRILSYPSTEIMMHSTLVASGVACPYVITESEKEKEEAKAMVQMRPAKLRVIPRTLKVTSPLGLYPPINADWLLEGESVLDEQQQSVTFYRVARTVDPPVTGLVTVMTAERDASSFVGAEGDALPSPDLTSPPTWASLVGCNVSLTVESTGCISGSPGACINNASSSMESDTPAVCVASYPSYELELSEVSDESRDIHVTASCEENSAMSSSAGLYNITASVACQDLRSLSNGPEIVRVTASVASFVDSEVQHLRPRVSQAAPFHDFVTGSVTPLPQVQSTPGALLSLPCFKNVYGIGLGRPPQSSLPLSSQPIGLSAVSKTHIQHSSTTGRGRSTEVKRLRHSQVCPAHPAARDTLKVHQAPVSIQKNSAASPSSSSASLLSLTSRLTDPISPVDGTGVAASVWAALPHCKANEKARRPFVGSGKLRRMTTTFCLVHFPEKWYLRHSHSISLVMDIIDLHPPDDYSHRFFIWHEWIQANGPLNAENVFEYFTTSMFYDKQSNNQVLRMQTMHTGTAIANEAEELKRFTGIEFAVVDSQPPSLFIIHKRERLSPDQVRPLVAYFVINNRIYQSPDVYTLLSNRLLTSLSALQSSLDTLRARRPDYLPRTGFIWPIVDTASQIKKKAAAALDEGADETMGTEPPPADEMPAEDKPKVAANKLQNNMLLLNAMRATALHSKTAFSAHITEAIAEPPVGSEAAGAHSQASTAPVANAKTPAAASTPTPGGPQDPPTRSLPGAGKKKRKRTLAAASPTS